MESAVPTVSSSDGNCSDIGDIDLDNLEWEEADENDVALVEDHTYKQFIVNASQVSST